MKKKKKSDLPPSHKPENVNTLLSRVAAALHDNNDINSIIRDTGTAFRLKYSKSSQFRRSHGDLQEFLPALAESCDLRELRVAFVGMPGNGCSTLINSLIGHGFAPVSSPCDFPLEYRSSKTCSITVCSRSSPGSDEVISVENIDSVSAKLADLADLAFPTRDNIRYVRVGIPQKIWQLPDNTVLVDAPAPDCDDGSISDKIRRVADSSNAVFVCINAEKLAAADFSFLTGIFRCCSHNPRKIYVVATHWDRLREPERDWQHLSRSLAERLSGNDFFADNVTANTHLLHTAANIRNICRGFGRDDLYRVIPAAQLAMNYYPPQVSVKMLTDPGELLPELDKLSNISEVCGLLRDTLPEEASSQLPKELARRLLITAGALTGCQSFDKIDEKLQKLLDETPQIPLPELAGNARSFALRRYEKITRPDKITQSVT